MKNAFAAELTRLSGRRTVVPALAAAILYAVTVTWILIATASPTPEGMLTITGLENAGGATRSVALASTFASVLVLALFIGMAAGDHSRGTWRAALLQNPNRLRLAAGTAGARLTVMAVIVAALFATGFGTAFAAASFEGIDTATWLTSEGLRVGAEDLGKTLVFMTGWAILGSVIGVLTRSVPIGLAIGVAWAGPIENAIGDDRAFAERWFPGLLLRHIVTGVTDYSTAQIAGTLAAYGIVAVAAVGLVLTRRDVTS